MSNPLGLYNRNLSQTPGLSVCVWAGGFEIAFASTDMPLCFNPSQTGSSTRALLHPNHTMLSETDTSAFVVSLALGLCVCFRMKWLCADKDISLGSAVGNNIHTPSTSWWTQSWSSEAWTCSPTLITFSLSLFHYSSLVWHSQTLFK